MHNLAVTVVVSEIFYTQADLCIIILCIMRMSTVLSLLTVTPAKTSFLGYFKVLATSLPGKSGSRQRRLFRSLLK